MFIEKKTALVESMSKARFTRDEIKQSLDKLDESFYGKKSK